MRQLNFIVRISFTPVSIFRKKKKMYESARPLETLDDYKAVFKEQKEKAEGALLRAAMRSSNHRDRELKKHVEDFATPMTEELALIIGKLRREALKVGSPRIDGLLEELQNAIDDQMYLFFLHRAEEQKLPLATNTDFGLRQRRIEDQLAIAEATQQAKQHPPSATAAIQVELDDPFEHVAAFVYLLAESIAKTTRCERVRVYLSVEDGLGARHITSFPAEEAGSPTPLIPRALASACFSRGIAISGHSNKEIVAQSNLGELVNFRKTISGKKLKSDSDLGLPKTTLAFPIFAWKRRPKDGRGPDPSHLSGAEESSTGGAFSSASAHGGYTASDLMARAALATSAASLITSTTPETQLIVVGVIECLNKESGGEDDGSRFTVKDELFLLSASQLLGALIERYPFYSFQRDVSGHFSTYNKNNAKSHLPPTIVAEIRGAAIAANHSLRVNAMVPIYHGPTASLQRFTVGDKASEKMQSQIGMHQINSDLKNIEESLDSLNMMWKTAHDENVAMHRQCRWYAAQLKKVQLMLSEVPDMFQEGRQIHDIEELHRFLREKELVVKSGDPDKNKKATAATPLGSDRCSAESTPDLKFRGTIAELHYDGPNGVRPYTVDPTTKKLQERAIDAHVNAAEKERSRLDQIAWASIPKYSLPTQSSSTRVAKDPVTNTTALPPFQRSLQKTPTGKNSGRGGINDNGEGDVLQTSLRLKIPRPPSGTYLPRAAK